MLNEIERVLVSEEEIKEITSNLANQIMRDYAHSTKPLILIIILKGFMPFASDLMKKLDLPLELEFMKVSSYGAGTKNSGEIKLHLDLARENLEKYDLLVIEDIVDSGRTLSRLTQLLKNRNANSVRTCTLLDKPSRREVPFTPDYCGKTIEDEFVVGYGLACDLVDNFIEAEYEGMQHAKRVEMIMNYEKQNFGE
jgi:hypoxanthine phosphoribosyltransferase